VITSYRNALRAAVPLLLASTAPALCFGFVEIARGALLLQTTGSVTYDSYFIGTVDNDPDTIYSLYPSLRYSRNAGRGSINASVGVVFNRHDLNKDLDSDDLRANFSIDLPTVEGARLEGNFNIDYSEATVVDLFVNDRVASETLSTNLALKYRLGPRMTLAESFGYSEATREIYSDQEMISNQLSFTYKGFLRGASLILTHGVTFTETSGDNFVGVGLDQEAHNVSLGLSRPIYGEVSGTLSYGYSLLRRSSGETINGETSTSSAYISASIDGPFLPRNRFPKLTSSASLSYSQSATAGINDGGGKFLSGHLNLAWAARLRTKLHIRASRSIDLSVSDLTVENTRIGGGFDQQIGRATNLNGSVGYTWSTYRGVDRSDSTLDANVGISRSFNKYLSAGASYMYQNNQNTSTGFQPGRFAPRDYDRHTATASVTVTF
jgi:hypothetical protein